MRLVFVEPGLRRLDPLRQVNRIKCPTLNVASEENPITPVAEMEDLAAALRPDLASLERFANTGHGRLSRSAGA